VAHPSSFAAGDFDNDSQIDLVVAYPDTGHSTSAFEQGSPQGTTTIQTKRLPQSSALFNRMPLEPHPPWCQPPTSAVTRPQTS